jgi:hypothetical protein
VADRAGPLLLVDGVASLLVGVLLLVVGGLVIRLVGRVLAGGGVVEVEVRLRRGGTGYGEESQKRDGRQHPSHAHEVTCV